MATPALSAAAPRNTTRDMSLSAVLDNPRLPSPPALALQIVQKASQPDCDLDALTGLLRQDSALCGRVLKTVNSGLFALNHPISSLKQAVVILGVKPLRSLVLSLALPAMQSSERDGFMLDYWRQSVAGSVLARQLAIHLGQADPEDDLVAGLLRDLGILVLREAFPEEYRAVWNSASANWVERQCDEERTVFGFDHTEVSACLLESWNLPVELVQPIRYHHDPEGAASSSEVIRRRSWLLHFASRIAMLHEDSSSDVEELLQLSQEQFALDLEGLTAFLDTVIPRIEEFARILNLNLGQCPNYAAILTAGSETLVRLSLEASHPRLPNAFSENLQTIAVAMPVMPANSSGGQHDFDVSCLDPTYDGPGFHLKGYEVSEVIGRGGMGVVFKASDPARDRIVAIKMPTPACLAVAESRARFLREARTSGSIEHPNVVRIYAVDEIHGLPYIVMEYVAGRSFEAILDKQGPLAIADVIRYGQQIAAALHAAHLRRIVHRDMKPANILLDEESDQVKITDFGLARVLDDPRLSQSGMLAGTPQFMAPEQFQSGRVDHRADLFALGSVLYAMCAGTPPFRGDSVLAIMNQICHDKPRPLRMRRSDVPPWLESLIARLHAKSPATRCASAAEVAKVLERQGA